MVDVHRRQALRISGSEMADNLRAVSFIRRELEVPTYVLGLYTEKFDEVRIE
jgi:hypothetical protein